MAVCHKGKRGGNEVPISQRFLLMLNFSPPRFQDEATPGTWGLISLSPAADAFVLGGRTQKSALACWEMGGKRLFGEDTLTCPASGSILPWESLAG